MSACTRMIGGHDTAIFAGGHTHIRMLRAHRGREVVNPGSVGLAYQFFPDGSVRVPPWAEFAMLSEAGPGVASIDFRRVPYDRDATVRAMIECEMPHGGQRIGASKVTAAHGISSPEIDLSSSACCS